MTHYEREASELIHEHMAEHATVQALLGVAYELSTANLLALDHALGLMREDDPLGDNGEELAMEVSSQILERLGCGNEPGRDFDRDA